MEKNGQTKLCPPTVEAIWNSPEAEKIRKDAKLEKMYQEIESDLAKSDSSNKQVERCMGSKY